MAIDATYAEFLIHSGADFSKVLTLGRLHLYCCNKELRRVLKRDLYRGRYDSARRFCEVFFRAMGASEVVSIDKCKFEGATIVHDLNEPLPDSLRNRFTAVVDAGLIEHVFNFPQVIQNAKDALVLGGHLLLATPANNYCGHGFYQFSPELWWRILSPAYGFEVREMSLVEYGPRIRQYEVSDPAMVGSRVCLVNKYPSLLFVCARKVGEAKTSAYPQQSDYVARWSVTEEAMTAPAWRSMLLEAMPRLARFMERVVNNLRQRCQPSRTKTPRKGME